MEGRPEKDRDPAVQAKIDADLARGDEVMKAELEKPVVTNLLGQIKNTLNPKYHWNQFKEDISAFLHALQSLRRGMDEHDLGRIDDLFRGRLMIAFYISGPFNMVAVALTQVLQYALRLPEAVFMLPVVANLLTGIVFQLVWSLVNHQVYKRAYPHWGQRFIAFEKDMWPVHWTAIRLAAVFWVVNAIVLLIIVEAFKVINSAAAHNIPWVVITTLVEFVVVAPGFVRNIGDFFERHASALALKYGEVFTDCR